jgi:pseudaminic acid biosynthesis-associated methylase
MDFRTEQEEFWAGEFGDAYIERNKSSRLLASNLSFFSDGLKTAQGVGSAIELGANVGMNMQALRLLYPKIDLTAVEINSKAAETLAKQIGAENVVHRSLFDYEVDKQHDLAFVKGVLIHLKPELIEKAYEKLYQASSRYIFIGEYYNPYPTSVVYNGHKDRLFKRDFAGEMLDIYSDLKLLDYGFAYHRDNNFPQDDISWFLLEKRT